MKAKKIIIGLVAVIALLITIATALAVPTVTYSPNTNTVTVQDNLSQAFSAVVTNSTGTLAYEWEVDNVDVGNASSYTFDGNTHAVGQYQVSVVVTEDNLFVDNKVWTVTVEDAQPTNSLSISKIEVNGKTNGKLTLSEINEIEIEVSNDYTEDIEDITVTVRILDVDGDDLEEEVEIDELKDGDEDTVTVEFDLSDEEVDEEEYTIEIEVEGEATDNSDHSDTETKVVEVDRENDDIIILEADLDNAQVTCPAQTSLDVVIKNVGENDQDGAKITVKNSALGVDLQRANIDLDDYSGSDNDYDASFALNLEEAKQGTYTLDVAVYSEDNDLMDSKEVELQVLCATETPSQEDSTDEQYADKELAAELQKKIDEYKALQESQGAPGAVRESNSYLLLLGVLVALLFFAAVLTATYLLIKKR